MGFKADFFFSHKIYVLLISIIKWITHVPMLASPGKTLSSAARAHSLGKETDNLAEGKQDATAVLGEKGSEGAERK